MQPDLFANGQLELRPASGRREPRLWVRRLIVWEEPGKAPIRTVDLRTGLNVIWSPDSGSSQGQIGHGGGKTTFCRLLRYCLGENSYGPESQRAVIGSKMPLAEVGAEVRLDGETWLIRRTMGVHKEDYAVVGPSFADVIGWPDEPTGMSPFRRAALHAFLGSAADLLPASIEPDQRWQAFLAWLTRDQECRFAHLLDWRSPDSGSHSPLSGRNKPHEDRLAIVRIALDALQEDELNTGRQRDSEADRLAELRKQVGQLEWQVARERSRLGRFFRVAEAKVLQLDVAALKTMAIENAAKAQDLANRVALDQLNAAREELEAAAVDHQRLQGGLESLAARKEDKALLAKIIGDELPELTAQNQKVQNPVCPVCGVRIDEARANGCGISLEPCDLDSLATKVAQSLEMRATALAEVESMGRDQLTLSAQLVAAEGRLNQSRERLASLERDAFDRSKGLREAERSLDDVLDLEATVAELDSVQLRLAVGDAELKSLADELERHRQGVADAITRLSDRFDAVFRRFVPNDARSTVRLDGKGINIRLPVDGAAIDSLAVAVFDLAILTLAIEGETHHPGFLVHDSPREADLGRSIYASLFAFAKSLEGVGPSPLFQYIVTTTTDPPTEFCAEPWLRMQLRGSPVEERLLGTNL